LGAAPRQRRSIAEKRRIVEETLVEGASVARVARAHGINANQVFGWRRLYQAGRLGERKPAMKLLPVRVNESVPEALPVRGSADFPKAQPGHDSHRTAASAGYGAPQVSFSTDGFPKWEGNVVKPP
jgi:transposase-like protein